MLDIAAAGGTTQITATPHYRGAWKDWAAMRRVWAELRPEARARGIELTLGVEFFCEEFDRDILAGFARTLMRDGTGRILFELSRYSQVAHVEDMIYALQAEGLTVLIAHPERNLEFRRSVRAAQRYLDICCELVLSSSALALWPLSGIRRAAMREYKSGRYAYIASDAHSPEDYERHIRLLARINKGVTE